MALFDLDPLKKNQKCHTALGHSFLKYPKRPDLFTVTDFIKKIIFHLEFQTTGVLTATIWEQTCRAGITAAAGTRLALC